MTNEDLMNAVAEVARERDQTYESWYERLDALAARELCGTERLAFEEELAGSAEGSRALELFTPLSDDLLDRIADRASKEAKRPASLARRLLGSRTPWAGFAMAAALLLVWLPAESQPLPELTVEVQGGITEVRGTASRTTRFGPGSRMEVILRAASAHAGEMDVVFFLTRPGELIVLDNAVQRRTPGSIRMVAVLGKDVDIPAGDWTLWIGYGPAGSVAGAEELLEMDAAELHATRTRVQSIPIHVQPT